jgi:hypothetical protein
MVYTVNNGIMSQTISITTRPGSGGRMSGCMIHQPEGQLMCWHRSYWIPFDPKSPMAIERGLRAVCVAPDWVPLGHVDMIPVVVILKNGSIAIWDNDYFWSLPRDEITNGEFTSCALGDGNLYGTWLCALNGTNGLPICWY